MSAASRKGRTYPVCLGILLIGLLSLDFSPGYSQTPDNLATRIETLKKADVDVLAPDAFSSLQKALDRYRKLEQEKKPEQEKARALNQLMIEFEKTEDLLSKNQILFSQTLNARVEAVNAGAPTLTPGEFQSAESILTRAVNRAENRKISEADQLGREALIQYRSARNKAMNIQLLGETKTILARADQKKMAELTPVSLDSVLRLIEAISSEIESNPVDMSPLKLKASDAERLAGYTIRLTARIDSLRRDVKNWENMLLRQSLMTLSVSELAGINPDPGIDAEATLDQALKTIKKREAALTEERAGLQTRLERMQASMDSLRQEFNREQIRIAALVDEYQRDLQLRKENLDQTRRELGAEIRSKAALDMVGQARTQIAPGEAMVIREDKSVTLRLVGLEFATGQTAFSLRNRPMLDKLVQILAAYPSGKITIEGHTDATGREERNEEISRLRAEAVKEYLVSRNESLKDRMTVKGYGSSRPISSNDTPGAREANRRIDVIIVF